MITDIYLARHGETVWNLEKKLQGQLDSPLTERGKQQAEGLAQQVQTLAVTGVVHSPLGRARETALICQARLQIPLVDEHNLQERCFGDWQGEKKHDLKAKGIYSSLIDKLNYVAPPNGESALSSAERLYRCLESIAKSNVNQRVLVISHGDIIRCFCKFLAVNSGDEFSGKTLQNCEFHHLAYCHSRKEFQLNS